MKDLKVKISGTSGQGIISAGDILSYATARKGYYVTTFRAFPSEIRGDGKCYYTLRISENRRLTATGETDILVCLDETTIYEGLNKISSNGVLIYDSELVTELKESREDIVIYGLPLTTLAKELNSERSRNMVALGVVVGLLKNLNLEEQILSDIELRYKLKSQEIIDVNKKALNIGFEYACKKLVRKDIYDKVNMQISGAKLIMSGNEAIGLAALAAGCRFFSGYPITPATEIMEWLAKELPKFGGKMVQCEDEIAAINYALGASFAGVKSMTATSGPGLSLMQEAIGLASMSELPVVIADVQRCGPSTGMPTKTEQSDLCAAIYGTHGDCPKIVLAPMNVEDCFYQTINAFNFAEQYQVPVIILSDASLGPRRECVDLIDLDNLKIVNRHKPQLKEGDIYNRFEDTPSGISPITSVGDKYGEHVITGLEHTEANAPTPAADVHRKMTEKRFRKLETATGQFSKAKTYGSEDASIGIISWGSTSGAVFEAIDMAQKQGIKVQALYPRTLYPLPTDWIKNFIKNKDVVIVVEANYNAQFKSTIVERCTHINRGMEVLEFLKYDGTPFNPEEIYDEIQKVAKLQKDKELLSTNKHTHF
ncbi:MAG: 2-oxoacid:acceptor oxidoreductase subunit alpha [Candidatus Gastranaerophilales bacterium]|nr:2-oxoacid:acceptor oxidoreductase subunit alpha [Candidatus Gastranaerophilales bacterium]